MQSWQNEWDIFNIEADDYSAYDRINKTIRKLLAFSEKKIGRIQDNITAKKMDYPLEQYQAMYLNMDRMRAKILVGMPQGLFEQLGTCYFTRERQLERESLVLTTSRHFFIDDEGKAKLESFKRMADEHGTETIFLASLTRSTISRDSSWVQKNYADFSKELASLKRQSLLHGFDIAGSINEANHQNMHSNGNYQQNMTDLFTLIENLDLPYLRSHMFENNNDSDYYADLEMVFSQWVKKDNRQNMIFQDYIVREEYNKDKLYNLNLFLYYGWKKQMNHS